MGFVLVARPQHMVSGHEFQAFCQDEAWYRAKWDQNVAHEDPRKAYWHYAEQVRLTATKGGLMELSAACTAYCLQAV
eukprot:12918982-Prorocentrum_lima.AAC.1